MKTFDSQHYELIGYIPRVGWKIKPFRDDTLTIIAECAKFVKAGKVVYLKDDGSVEDKSRSKVLLSTLSE